MLPIKLTIEGLYSYKESQTIDFEPLLSNQLFGIFGEVGSGKSSILEAIIFALFGETDRLNSRDSRAYNMMNLQSNRLFIDFECWAGKSGKEKFRFTYEAKRNSKRHEDIRTPSRRVFCWDKDQWAAMEQANIEEIIGMNYKNFRQTVIIPQGKFRDFVQKRPKERTEMLQELFQLDQYDLYNQSRSLAGKNRIQLERNQAIYEQLESVTKEKSTQLKALISRHQVQKKEFAVQLDHSRERLKKLEALRTLHQELEQLSIAHKALVDKKNGFQLRQSQLEDYQKARNHFQDKIKNLKDVEQQFLSQQNKLQKLQAIQQQLAQKKAHCSKSLEKAKSDYLEKDTIRQNCDDLEHIIETKKIQDEITQLQQKQVKHQSHLATIDLQIEEKSKSVTANQEELHQLKAKQVDLITLKDLESLLSQQASLKLQQQQLSQQKADVIKNKHEISSQTEKLTATFISTYQLEAKAFSEYKFNAEKNIENIDNQLLKLKTQQAFSNQAAQLSTGDACPLCGSEHHPKLAHAPSILTELEHYRAAKQKQKNLLQDLASLELKIGKLEASAQQLTNKQQEQNDQFQAIKEQITHVDQQLSGEKFIDYQTLDLNSLQTNIKQQQQYQQQIIKCEANYKTLRSQLDQLKSNREKTLETNFEDQNRLTALQSENKTHLASLKRLDYAKFASYSIPQLDANLAKGKAKLVQIESVFESQQQAFEQINQEWNTVSGQLSSLKETVVQLDHQYQTTKELINDTLLETGFTSLDVVTNLLQLQLDIIKEQQAIDEFHEQLIRSESAIASIKDKIDGKEIDSASWQEATAKVQLLENQYNDLLKQLAQAEQSLQVNEQQLTEKAQLKQLLSQLETRQANFKELEKLFKAKGFVEYVSSVYLQNLVYAANERFMKLTQNKLSLELNENLDFIIRDFLNGGKTRLLKTLSGGQTFQAALCLALALAENVKSLNQAEQSFFFLDEGFGTLDKASLKTVFETLKSLKKENRIVGIISHVEELKQEIEVALLVEQDVDRGSLIRKGWE